MEDRNNATAAPIPGPFPQPAARGRAQPAPALPAGEPEEPIPPDQAVAAAAPPQAGAASNSPICKVTCAESYFTEGRFGQDVATYSSYANRMTGFANLDSIQPLYPGFYVQIGRAHV